MANADEIRIIELRRLAELEKHRAAKGIDCEPHVLIEISDLRSKYGSTATAVSIAVGADARFGTDIRSLWNEVDFLRAICTSALRSFASDQSNRRRHQLIYKVWMISLTAMMFVLMALWLIR